MKAPFSIDVCRAEFEKEEIERSIPWRFETQVEKYPQRPAIKTKNGALTYAELNRKANRIARAVRAGGGEGGDPVALLLEPGSDLVAAILGALKAGRIWVLLDPSHPLDRLSYLLEDCRAGLILSHNKSSAVVDSLQRPGALVVDIDAISNEGDGNLDLAIEPDDYAHIIYTSGSTGKPKGVVHSHRLVLHNIWLHTQSFGLCHEDRISLFSSLSHQAGIADMFRALLNGATLLPYNLRAEGVVDLSSWLREERITIYHSVPTVFRQLIHTLRDEDEFPSLRVIHLGGEPVLKTDVDFYRKRFSSDCTLTVILGASEAPTFRQNFIGRETRLGEEGISVGYPVEDKEVFLLDGRGQKVEPDQVGEIAVRSSYLASEYWRKPELTRKAFLEDPEGGSKRIYRTGDLGRILPDGSLIYLGRADTQVKIGGQRIEIGEIETVLFGHPSLRVCAVVAKEDSLGEKYLAAYIVAKGRVPPSVSELQKHLKRKLPLFMVPSSILLLEEMPSLPNGKIDRKALQECEDGPRHLSDAEIVPPRDAFEIQLKDLWEEVLGVQSVGIKDNFFELGGTSLRAAHLSTNIWETFGQKLPLSAIFQAPTIEQVARMLRLKEWSEKASSLVAMRTGGRRPPFFCVPGNMSVPFISLRHLARHLGPEQPIYGFQDGVQNPSRIENLAECYLSEMTAVQPDGPYLLGGLCMGGVVAFEMAQQLMAKGQEVALLALMESVPPRGLGVHTLLDLAALYFHRVTRRLLHHSQVGLQLSGEERRAYFRIKMKVNANSWAHRRYSPRPYPGRIGLFLTPETLEAPAHPRLGWRNLAVGGAEIHRIEGTNGSITGHEGAEVVEADARYLARKLTESIDMALDGQAETRGSGARKAGSKARSVRCNS